ncbi:hypothetical protein vBEfaSHEf13_082 [Enterococcus phage vB_EfaS_HEf13]|nr:hypothetical protein vBEfaSHEf13_082 [Enterococcus phage vB_EfaS_HEf13]
MDYYLNEIPELYGRIDKMLVFTDKGKLRKRIKELEESLRESEYNEGHLRKQVNRLVSEITSMDYRHEQDEERWTEQLESYEEKLIQRDLKISSMELLHEQLEEQIESLEEELEKASEGSVAMLSDLRLAESAYESLNELLQKVTESLKESGERQLELEEELHDAKMEIERLKEQSKSPYPTVTINVDVRDALTVQLSKALKQANEAFEKRSKEKRYIFSCEGLDYSSDNRTELARCIDSMYKLSLHDYASLVRLLENLEKELEHKDFANGGRSFYSNKLQERVFITLKATKEEI